MCELKSPSVFLSVLKVHFVPNVVKLLKQIVFCLEMTSNSRQESCQFPRVCQKIICSLKKKKRCKHGKKEKKICWPSEKLSKHFFFPYAERRVRQRERSVCRRSGRSPLCVTLSCVITSRIIGSVGGNSKRGYGGQSDSEGKV